jgi:carbonic anhydrase
MMKISALILLAICISAISCDCTYNYSNPNTDWPNVTCTTSTNTCNTNTYTSQSPINVVRTSVSYPTSTTDTNISVVYNAVSGLKIKNTQHTQKVTITDGKITVDGVEYTLAQYHWHQPAEHTFDGMYYDAELHFVHATTSTTATNKYLVIAVFFQIGDESTFDTNNQFANLSATSSGEVSLTASINPWDIIQPAASQGVYQYSGSFTTPPCTEGVLFLLTRIPQTMTKTQWTNFKTSMASFVTMDYANGTGNIRPTQALNTRTVAYKYYEFVNTNGKIIALALGFLAFLVMIN